MLPDAKVTASDVADENELDDAEHLVAAWINGMPEAKICRLPQTASKAVQLKVKYVAVVRVDGGIVLHRVEVVLWFSMDQIEQILIAHAAPAAFACRAFAAKHTAKMDFWRKVVFSDEKKFNLDGPDVYRAYWRDLRSEEKVFSKRSEIAFLEGRQSSGRYCKTFETYLIPFLD
ncbi:hypothetical protein H310_07715 [Aphanomyces invadans]|uniref:Uncharacterized protein n=1 Tax=Aphanomyces invadans TaxID=157072 RepID=A0A024U163_9STRA|nr:hypothetical protein H310_07715 [Aphanomyces invadans]ETV99646.1 hypothetical protein H310_07715 [Aphanomyces invadans]|eukprot:XP_008871422.1 hypothetical protein H310_07715 [Aphanomyces invadans]